MFVYIVYIVTYRICTTAVYTCRNLADNTCNRSCDSNILIGPMFVYAIFDRSKIKLDLSKILRIRNVERFLCLMDLKFQQNARISQESEIRQSTIEQLQRDRRQWHSLNKFEPFGRIMILNSPDSTGKDENMCTHDLHTHTHTHTK